jgi:hypothetical protein
MNIFKETSYRRIVDEVIKERRRDDPSWTFQALAEATRIPKSYVSKVMHQTAHFSADQLFLVCDHLEFDESESAYVQLLLEWERCGVERRKRQLKARLAAMQAAALDTKHHLKAGAAGTFAPEALEKYYLDPMNQVVHMGLSVPALARDLPRLAAKLEVPLKVVTSIVERLERLGVVERTASGTLRTLRPNLHLPKDSPVYRAWLAQLKLLAADRLLRRPRPEDYSFSVSFSATPAVKVQLQAEFLQLLKRAEALVEGVAPAEREGAFQMSFELFAWS